MRNLTLTPHYDLVIVGGGIQGCAMLWEAQSRGLNTLLVEAGDYCAQTSANSLKTIHGGIRYLQSLNFARTIGSAKEQETLLSIAPHLIKQLPCLLPTERKLTRSRLAVSLGFALYNLTKSHYCAGMKLPRARCISKAELSQYCPLINTESVTGAGVWYDAQVQHAERLGLAFVKTAQRAGAHAYNYLRAEQLTRQGSSQFQVRLKCQLSQREHRVCAASVVFCTAQQTAMNISGLIRRQPEYPEFCLAVNLVANYRYAHTALGLKCGFAREDATSSNRLLFAAPWRDKTLLGTWYFKADAGLQLKAQPNQTQIAACIDDINATYPGIKLKPEHIHQVHHGWLPLKNGASEPAERLMEEDLILTPADPYPLYTVIPTKYTTCRAIAEQTIDALATSGKFTLRPSVSASQPLWGAQTGKPENDGRLRFEHGDISQAIWRQLVSVYGEEASTILVYCQRDQQLSALMPGTRDIIRAQLDYELEFGQVQKPDDFIFRRSFAGHDHPVNPDLVGYCQRRINAFHLSRQVD